MERTMNQVEERSETTTKIVQQVLITGSFLFSITLAMNFHIRESILFALFTTLNITCGLILYTFIKRTKEFNTAELLGIGIALGTSCPAIINVVLRFVGITSHLTTLVFPLLMIPTIPILRRKLRDQKVKISAISVFDLHLILFTSLISGLAWTNSLLPYSTLMGTFFVLIFFLRKKQSLDKTITQTILSHGNIVSMIAFPFLALISSTISSWWRKAPIWKELIGVDVAFDEAQSHGVSSFGITDNILRASNPTKGHILTHAWAGDIASFLDLPRFLSTGGVGFSLGIIGISSIVIALAIREFDSINVGRIALLIIFLQASLPEEFLIVAAPRMANSLSLLLLFSFLFLYLDYSKKELNLPYFILPLFMSLLTLAKLHWGMVAVSAIAFVGFCDLVRQKTLSSTYIPIISFLTFVTTYWFFLRGMDAHSPVDFKFTFDMAAIIVSFLILRFHFLTARKLFQSESRLFLLALSFILFAVPLLIVTNGSNNTSYFVNAALVIWSLFVAEYFLDSLMPHPERLKTFWFYGSFGFSIGLATSVFFLYANYRLIGNPYYKFLQILIVQFPQLLQLFVISLTFLFILLATKFMRKSKFSRSFISFPLALTLSTLAIGSNLGTWSIVSNRPLVLSIWYDIADNPDYVFNSDQFLVGEWLINNTDPEALLATNSICAQLLQRGDSTPHDQFGSDCKNRNMFTWIAALAHRKLLFESPLTGPMSIGNSLSDLEVSDYNSVVNFGSTIDISSRNNLIARGVEYFIVDREQTASDQWNDMTDIVFTSERYFVIKF
jgi:hypothetical protein